MNTNDPGGDSGSESESSQSVYFDPQASASAVSLEAPVMIIDVTTEASNWDSEGALSDSSESDEVQSPPGFKYRVPSLSSASSGPIEFHWPDDNTFTLIFDLERFCDAIIHYQSLGEAELISAELYAFKSGRILHHFIILELRRKEKTTVFMRLDYRPDATVASFLRRLGSVPAICDVRLASSKFDLGVHLRTRLKNRQILEMIVTLRDFQAPLRVISQEVVVYRIWPENCYFFCSLIQDYLSACCKGIMVAGALGYPNLARNTRGRIMRLLNDTSEPFSISSDSLIGEHDDFASPNAAVFPDDNSSYASSRDSKYFTPRASVNTLHVPGAPSTNATEADHFLTANDGHSFLENIDPLQPLPRPLSRIPSCVAFASAALSSVDSVVTRKVLHNKFALEQVCDVILYHSSLRKAQIVSTECYAEKNGGILHRFLVLELYREKRRPICLRLDRRAGPMLGLVRGLGSVPAQDTAEFSEDKSILVGKALFENRQEFETVPTLMELQHFLSVICQELTTYTVWPENCYFFCSLIQEHLGAESDGQLIQGAFHYADLAVKCRQRLKEKVRLFYHIPQSLPLSELLRSCEDDGLSVDASTALNLSLKWELTGTFSTLVDETTVSNLQKALAPIIPRLSDQRQHSKARELSKHRIALLRRLKGHDLELSASLFVYSRCLYKTGLTQVACVMGAEGIALMRSLYERHPWTYRRRFSEFLHHYAVILQKAGQVDEACGAGAEAVTIIRTLYKGDTGAYLEQYSASVHHHLLCLREAERISEACEAYTEYIDLKRYLFLRGPQQHWKKLSEALRSYARYLRNAERLDEACEVSGEHVSLIRALWEGDPERYLARLSASLRHHVLYLSEAKRAQDTCEAYAEFIRLQRHLFNHHPQRHWAGLSAGLRSYAKYLRAAKRLDDACEASAEHVDLMRGLYERDQARNRDHLVASLHHHVLCLREAGRIEETSEAEQWVKSSSATRPRSVLSRISPSSQIHYTAMGLGLHESAALWMPGKSARKMLPSSPLRV